MLLALSFANVRMTEQSPGETREMSVLEEWDVIRDEVSGSDPGFPEVYPLYEDDGSMLADPSAPSPLQWGEYWVSDAVYQNMFSGRYLEVTDGGGNFFVGHGHENWIGDQNGDGILEGIVFYFYFPWMHDGLDNDGDGCVDEKDLLGTCNFIPDAMAVYETGFSPRIGGDNGTLLINSDWKLGRTEVYRVFVTPPWHAYQIRSTILFPQIAGEFISFSAYEYVNGINSNPEMDNDFADSYVGIIDARQFPSRSPRIQACSAGELYYVDSTFQRDDGWVVTAYSLVESYDNHDWNGDGDTSDWVASYYAIDPATGNCRQNVVNTGVYGQHPTTSGDLITPMYTYEYGDSRDWDLDQTHEYQKLYHNVSSTWSMKGPAYTSYTFTASVPAWGFGWWGLYDSSTYRAYPGKTFIGVQIYVGSWQGYYHTYFVQTEDEDGNRHTYLPQYFVGYGQPINVHGGTHIEILVYERYLREANVWLMPTVAGDGNGDYNIYSFLHYVFCPDQVGGGGGFLVEETSKYAKGLYQTPIPVIWSSSHYVLGDFEIDGTVTVPINVSEAHVNEDCNGDGQFGYTYCSSYYQYSIR